VKRFAFATVFVCLFLLAACNGNRPPKIGEKAPDFSVTDSEHTVTLSQLRGKPVLLNFWATWCPPCISEMPSLVELQKQLGDKVVILAVSEDADDAAYKQFVRDHNVDLLTVRDPKNMANTLYGTFQFPETYVIDKDGVIRRKFIGAADWTNPEIIEYLNKLEGKS
jgi:cytochrome c biogenesis protein CcmG, thiol:disulfide interchange protein DsbE